jgi:hypothetical protein
LCQNTETTKLQKKIQILQEENQSLKSQLQVEKGNVIILKEQHILAMLSRTIARISFNIGNSFSAKCLYLLPWTLIVPVVTKNVIPYCRILFTSATSITIEFATSF